MMNPGWIQTKTNTGISLQGEAERLQALSQQLEVGGLLTARHSSASHVHQPHRTCPSVLLTWPTRRQCQWLMVPWKTENHYSQWHNQQSHSSHFATSLSHCRRHFSSLLLKPVLMMIMRRSSHDCNYSHTTARGWGRTFYTFKWSRDT